MFHNKWQIVMNLYIFIYFLLNWLIIFEKCERWISRKCIQLVDRKSSTNQIFPFKILRKNEIVWPLKISLANSGLYKYIFLWTLKFEYFNFCSISLLSLNDKVRFFDNIFAAHPTTGNPSRILSQWMKTQNIHQTQIYLSKPKRGKFVLGLIFGEMKHERPGL